MTNYCDVRFTHLSRIISTCHGEVRVHPLLMLPPWGVDGFPDPLLLLLLKQSCTLLHHGRLQAG